MERIDPYADDKLPNYFIICNATTSHEDIAAFRASIPDHIPQADIKILVVDDNHGLSDVPDAPLSRVYFLNPRNFDITITKSEEFKLQKLPEDYLWRVHHCRKSFTKTGKRQAHSPVFFRQKRPFAKKYDSH